MLVEILFNSFVKKATTKMLPPLQGRISRADTYTIGKT